MPLAMTNHHQFVRVDYLVKCLKKKNILHVFASPGSRNAPLLIAFVKHQKFQIHSVIDERSAAFQALGAVDFSGTPAIITCTSGSAVANYYPAVTEAFFRRKPLLILTADRPQDKINIREGQTIFQENIFGSHCIGAYNLGMTEESAHQDKLKIDEALQLLLKGGESGPVHINIPLEEPLYQYIESDEEIIENEDSTSVETAIKEEFPAEELENMLLQGKKVALIIGQDLPDASALEYLIDVNVKSPFLVIDGGLGNTPFTKCIKHPNELIDRGFQAPDLILTTGQEILHKKFKNHLRNQKNLEHWHFEKNFAPDTFGKLSKKFTQWGLKDLLFYLASKDWSNYSREWKISTLEMQKEYYLSNSMRIFNLPFSDLLVLKILVDHLAYYSHIALGNSSLVRNFLKINLYKSFRLYGNRGVAGIDGSLSTAVGMATQTQENVYCILGDLSFFYDQNALLSKNLPNNLKIIVINNGGGEIFKMIDGPEVHPEIAELQQTPHHFDTAGSCKTAGITRLFAEDEISLKDAINHWMRCKETCLLEVKTHPKSNQEARMLLN